MIPTGPVEFKVGEFDYRAPRLDVFVAFDVYRKLFPVFVGSVDAIIAVFKRARPGEDPTLADFLDAKVANTIEPLVSALSKMSNDDADFVIKSCLSVVSRRENDQWAPIMAGTRIAYADIRVPDMIHLVWRVVRQDVLPFTSALRENSTSDRPPTST